MGQWRKSFQQRASKWVQKSGHPAPKASQTDSTGQGNTNNQQMSNAKGKFVQTNPKINKKWARSKGIQGAEANPNKSNAGRHSN